MNGPAVPDELACLFAAAATTNKAVVTGAGPGSWEPPILVTPFPPRSWLYQFDPDGWSFSTESWSITLRPMLTDDGVTWRVVFDDDSGAGPLVISAAVALAILAGNPAAVDDPR